MEILHKLRPQLKRGFERGDICIYESRATSYRAVVVITWASSSRVSFKYMDSPDSFGQLNYDLPLDQHQAILHNTYTKHSMPPLEIDLEAIDRQRDIVPFETIVRKARESIEKVPLSPTEKKLDNALKGVSKENMKLLNDLLKGVL